MEVFIEEVPEVVPDPVLTELLRTLDSFKTLMCKSVKQLPDIEGRLLAHPFVAKSSITLEFQSCLVEDVFKLVGWDPSDIQFLVDAFSVTRTDKAKVVPILDLLTTLCIFMSGEVEEKAVLLFKWYNLNKLGLLEEDEHYLMIRRIGLCFKKLHILGSIDLTDEEAKYLAMKARIYTNEQGVQKFKPGLLLPDFTQWIYTSDECKGYFTVISLMNRLIDVLISLDRYSDKLLEIAKHQIEQPTLFLPPVPPNKKINISCNIRILYRSSNSVTLTVIDEGYIKYPRISGVYIQISREHELPYILYEIAPSIIDRHSDLEAHRMQENMPCCTRYYLVKEVISTVIEKPNPHQVLYRITVPALQAGGKYQIKVMKDTVEHYRPVRLKTIEDMQDDNYGICILPTNVGSKELEVLMRKSREKWKEFVMIYTGPICDFSEVLNIFPREYLSQPIDNLVEFHAIYEEVLSILREYFRRQWKGNVFELLERVIVYHDKHHDYICNAQYARQLLFYPGLSTPLLDPQVKYLLKCRLGPYCSAMLRLIEYQYIEQFMGLFPFPAESYCISLYNTTVYYVTSYSTLCNVNKLIDIFTTKISNIEMEKQDIVLLVRSIEDLMYIFDIKHILKEPTLAQYNSSTSKKVVKDPSDAEDKSMRGKYEILYGEYRPSNSESTEIKSTAAFTKFVEILFSYIISYTQQTTQSTSVRIVSCHNDKIVENFRLIYEYQDVEYSIVHESLVSTETTAQPSSQDSEQSKSAVDLLLKQMLPKDVVYQSVPDSKLRAVVYGHKQSVDILLGELLAPIANLPGKDSLSTSTLSEQINHDLKVKYNLVSSYNDILYEPIHIKYAGIASLTAMQCRIVIETKGVGIVRIFLYSIPYSMTDKIFKKAIKKDRTSIKVIEEKTCIGNSIVQKHNVQFDNLRSHCMYGVCIVVDHDKLKQNMIRDLRLTSDDASVIKEKKTRKSNDNGNEVVTFDPYAFCTQYYITFKTAPSTLHIFSTIFVPGRWKEYMFSSIRSRRLLDVSRLLKTSIDHVYTVYSDDTAPLLQSAVSQDFLAQNNLASSFHSVYTLPTLMSIQNELKNKARRTKEELIDYYDIDPDAHTDSSYPLNRIYLNRNVDYGFEVQHQGFYCILSPKYNNYSSLQEMVPYIRSLSILYPHIESVILMTSKLLVHAIAKTTKYTATTAKEFVEIPIGINYPYQSCAVELFQAILQWKSINNRRKCIILGAGGVKQTTTIYIGKNIVHNMMMPNSAENTNELEQPSYLSSTFEPHKSIEELPSLYGTSSLESNSVLTLPSIWKHNTQCFTYIILPRYKDPYSYNIEEYDALGEIDEIITDPDRVRDHYLFTHSVLQFKEGIVDLGEELCYQVFQSEDIDQLSNFHITFKPANLELYYDAINFEIDSKEVFYKIDIVQHPDLYVPSVKVQAGLLDKQDQWVFIQEVLHKEDLFEIVLGPIVGKLNQTEARILFEFNMDLSALECKLIPIDNPDDESTHVSLSMSDITAFEPVVFYFTTLLPNTKYMITLPRLTKLRPLGTVKTLPLFSSSIGVIIVGGNVFEHMKIVQDITYHIQQYQSTQYRHLQLMNKFIYEENRDDSINIVENPSMWTLLGRHINLPGCTPVALFHLAPQTILSNMWNICGDIILKQCEDYVQYENNNSNLSQYYLMQCEHIIKDTIRILWSYPSISNIFSTYANFFLYHSQYNLSTAVLPEKMKQPSDAKELLQSIFMNQVYLYVASLYHPSVDTKHYFQSWTLGALVIVMLDLVSGRANKAKQGASRKSILSTETKNVNDSNAEPLDPDDLLEGNAGEQKGEEEWLGGFSHGFIDKGQWKALRAACNDDTIYQAVVLLEKPLLSVESEPVGTVPPVSSEADWHPWNPSADDLIQFLSYFIEWISKVRRRTNNAESRSVLFISSYKFPYITVFQDLKTGIKIHQLCVGDYSIGSQQKESIDITGFALTGKLGSIRYYHKLSDNINFRAESFGMDAMRMAASEAVNSNELVQGLMKENNGYAELKLLLDTWKPTGLWSNMDIDAVENTFYTDPAVILAQKDAEKKEREKHTKKRKADAVLIVGPILGTPSFVDGKIVTHDDLQTSDNTTKYNAKMAFIKRQVKVPILIESDKDTAITVEVFGLFDNSHQTIEIEHLPGRRPYVFSIGPLNVEDRYHIVLTGFRSSPFNSFHLTTNVDLNETNVAVVNCQTPPDLMSASLLMSDLRKRCSVSFGGINAVVHLNFQPDIQKFIQEIQNSKVLVTGLLEYYKNKVILPKFRFEAESMIEVMRELWREVLSKPSYRELLKSTTNIFMPKITKGSDVITPDSERTSKLPKTARFFQLIANYIEQEYVEQLRYPDINIHRYARSVLNDGTYSPEQRLQDIKNFSDGKGREVKQFYDVVYGEEDVEQGEKVRKKIVWLEGQGDLLENMLKLWLMGCHQANSQFSPWISPNNRVTIEQLPIINVSTVNQVEKQLHAYDKLFDQTKEDLDGPTEQKESTLATPIKASGSLSSPPTPDEEVLPESPTTNKYPSKLMNSEYITPCVRIILLSCNEDADVNEILSTTSVSMQRIWTYLQLWHATYSHRKYQCICPATSQGSKQVELVITLDEQTNTNLKPIVYFLDTIYRSTEFERRLKLAEREKLMPKKKLTVSQAKSKRAQKKKEDEEKVMKAAIKREMQEIFATQTPDGYILVHCQIVAVTSKVLVLRPGPRPPSPTPAALTGEEDQIDENAPKEPEQEVIIPPITVEEEIVDIITYCQIHYMGDMELAQFLIKQGQLPSDAADIPETYDLLQLPMWITKFCPNTPSLFVQDEVILVSKQSTKTKVILQDIEENILIDKILPYYQKSRLSELSRPEELREVDFSIEGVLTTFMKDILLSIWNEVLSPKQRAKMFNISDDFIRSFIFAQIIPDPLATCSQPQEFAAAVNFAFRHALEMKTAYSMKDTKRFEYILQAADESDIIIAQQELREQRLERALLEKKAEIDARTKAEELLESLSEKIIIQQTGKKPRKPRVTSAKRGTVVIVEEKKEVKLTQEEVEKVLNEISYDSDLEDLHNKALGRRSYIVPRTSEKIAEDDKQGDIKQAPSRKADKKNLGEDDVMDEKELELLVAKRDQWLQETMNAAIRDILESEFDEVVDRATASWLRDLVRVEQKVMTEEERKMKASMHISRLKAEQLKTKKYQGQNIVRFV